MNHENVTPQTNTPRTDDQFVDANKMVPTDCCNSAPEKRLADGIRYWDCSKCGATIKIENPVKDHNEAEVERLTENAQRIGVNRYEQLKKAEREGKEIRNALGDDGRRTHKELLEMAFKASGWKLWKEKYIDLKNSYIAEGQDPAGTIWEHADKLQKELKALEAEVERLRKEIIIREDMDNVAQEVWDEMKAELAALKGEIK